ncbi:hypothetical protein OG871_32015 [Kitasatospora sp. NBC_00374]|uniref:bpX5 domain-containing protein n=1 Tax=Kitasatospora sp. NBC_00374 TaxID=2975964 RepID=UPI0032439183
MSAPPGAPLQWHRREPPLPAAAVLALGPAVPALARATAERLAGGAALRAVADEQSLVVLGAGADLPWADGVRYLGRDGGTLLPTTACPTPAPALWRQALAPGDGLLLVLVPGLALVADLPTGPPDPAALTLLARGEEPS